ncbi:cobalamin biosynthesis protein CobD [Halarcobacter ebronensis]|uniref:Cobalamin biosynthesis protein CobD n=1 Tax=Halarcobacter ebronensis TaxID=1462615 RepID=A0A4Q0YHK4_9BACT|nr:adenosylcobinamide-phosphate synthase CbiB [Halarcobacter ebronensis]RXJ70126.1 cobalamin biosynthesis protein CobD [Halarcobacter ebronensis]
MYFSTTLIAYIIDYFFAEFEKIKFLKHPIIYMGGYIKWFEKRFYLDNIYRGFILTLSLICIVFSITYIFTFVDNILFQGFLCSFAISSKMLYESVKNVINSTDSKYAISMLVSRDTKEMNESEINKAAIETYAENLSDGVIAPLFYMICFGLVGAFVYKAINTLDSMVGYRNEKYENFGKVSAKLDDIANYIPARITALLIALLFLSKKAFLNFNRYGKKHESLNAGLPISAMALALDLKLGGPTSYFGIIKDKPYFGDGKKEITKEDVKKALSIKRSLDIFIVVLLSLFTIFSY